MEVELSESDSTLPWSWVIEALAKSPSVEVSLLCELVSKAPPLLGVSGNEAKEAVALRCLERLLSSPNAFAENVAVTELSEFRFDLSESCEAALQRITSGSKGSSDDLSSDIESFIKHKQGSLSKSTLEMLKDTIVEGIHPLLSSLKEISGLDVQEYQNQCVLNVPFDGGDPTSPPLKSDEEDHADGIKLAEASGCSSRSGDNCQQMPSSPRPENSFPCESGTNTLYNDNHVQEIDDASHYYQSPPAKKLKMDEVYGMQSKQHHSVSVGGNEMLNGTEAGECYQVTKKIGINDGKSNEKDDGKAKAYLGSHDQHHISPNNGDNCCEAVDLAFKGTNLSSQCVAARDSLAMTESPPNMCMKCNKGGQLLSCCASSCVLLFHESCLGCSISFDDLGNFYCPFCAYSHASSEYVKAKEKVSLARKNLSLFLGGRTNDQPVQDGNTSLRDDVNKDTLKNVDQTAAVKEGTHSVTKDAKPHQTSLEGNPLELSLSSSYLDANGLVLTARQHLSIKDAQGSEIIIQLSQGPAGIHAQVYHGCDGSQFGCNEQMKNGSVILAELERKNETTKCKITEIHEEASSESISDSEGYVLCKRNDGASPLPFPKPLREIPISPRSRRKKVPWTAEEEAMLKKGVDALVQAESQVIPWKAILDYGCSVFQPGRTPIDLKDKWRNIKARGKGPKVN